MKYVVGKPRREMKYRRSNHFEVTLIKTLAKSASAVFVRFPNFHSNPDEMRQLKAELYKVLLPVAQGKKMVEVAERLIKVRTP